MESEIIKKVTRFGLRVLLFFVLNEILSTGIHVLQGIIQGVHGAPSFVTAQMAVYGIVMKALQIIAYIILGNRIPVKNRFLKGLSFMFLFWLADYIPQILGMLGAYSPVLNPDAASFGTILSDSISYIKTGILLGGIFTLENHQVNKECKRKKLICSVLTSMLVFPAIIFVLERFVEFINPAYTCASGFAISKADVISFYVVFYLFLAVSGMFFPIFYRVTEYNSNHKNRWLVFSNVHGWMLWTPVVTIMPFFGISIEITIIFAVIMLIALYADTYLFCRIIDNRPSRS